MGIALDILKREGAKSLRLVDGRGVCGETLAGSRMSGVVAVCREAGVRTVVDLRAADSNGRLAASCRKFGLEYRRIPIEGDAPQNEATRRMLDDLFGIMDGEGFFLSGQQGMRLIDIVLALRYFYRDASEIPEMSAHIAGGVFDCYDLMHRVNAVRVLFPEVPDEELDRKRVGFLKFNRRKAEESRYDQAEYDAAVRDLENGEVWFSSKSAKLREFSNFYPSPFTLDGIEWRSVEQCYQCSKFAPGSEPYKRILAQTRSCAVKGIADHYRTSIDESWEEIKMDAMRRALHAKFSQNPELLDLYAEFSHLDLIHESPHDLFWGMTRQREGENHLGRMIVECCNRLLADKAKTCQSGKE